MAGDRLFQGGIGPTGPIFSIGRVGEDDIERTGWKSVSQPSKILFKNRYPILKMVQYHIFFRAIGQFFLNLNAYKRMGLGGV
jgi:hypothetical protein